MTAFCLRGSIIKTDLDGQITDIRSSALDVITRIGTNTLDVAYLGDVENPFAVSLGDYNLLFDTVHINDGTLPDHVEFFDLSADDGFSARVINFLFKTEDGFEERMYSIGETALPAFRFPGEASMFFAQHEPQKIEDHDDWSIPLAQAAGVQTNGVFVNLEEFDDTFNFDNDSFMFNDFEPAPDTYAWDVGFADATHAQTNMSVALGKNAEDLDNIGTEVDDFDHVTDPVLSDFNEG